MIEAAARPRPSILLMIADAFRADAYSAAPRAHVLAETPHLDALRRRSIEFTSAFSTFPLCTPARATLLTGRHVDAHNVVTNSMQLTPELPTFGQALRRRGYALSWVGKFHVSARDACTHSHARRHSPRAALSHR
jgi:N-acetylglucosamine-6-sulfatase